jgi:acetyl esterase/lipase
MADDDGSSGEFRLHFFPPSPLTDDLIGEDQGPGGADDPPARLDPRFYPMYRLLNAVPVAPVAERIHDLYAGGAVTFSDVVQRMREQPDLDELRQSLDVELRTLRRALLSEAGREPFGGEDKRVTHTRQMLLNGRKSGSAVIAKARSVCPAADCEVAGVQCHLFLPDLVLDARPAPVLLFIHGGGHTMGSIHEYQDIAGVLCLQSGHVVVSLEYPLAPENPFPAGFDACWKVLTTLFSVAHGHTCGSDTSEQVRALNLDSHQISVGGDSAGGNLSTALAVKTIQRPAGRDRISQLLLIYPRVSDRVDWESFAKFGEDRGLLLPTTVALFFAFCYCGGFSSGGALPSSLESNPLVCPEIAPDGVLREFPRTLVLTAELDVLRDEGEAFAARLAQLGVDATCVRAERMIHGFMNFASLVNQDAFTQMLSGWLRGQQPRVPVASRPRL